LLAGQPKFKFNVFFFKIVSAARGIVFLGGDIARTFEFIHFSGLPSPPERKSSVFFSGKLARKFEFIYKFGQAGCPKRPLYKNNISSEKRNSRIELE
jgi:hypothetical protein